MLTQLRDEHVAQAGLLHPLRAAIVQEAFEWLGTPFVDCGYVKGPAGAVDCGMSMVGIFSADTVGKVPKDFDPRPYNPDWHLHQTEERYLKFLELFAHRVLDPLPGDIGLYKFGNTASHGAVILSDDLIIHAHKHVGKVDLCERRLLEPERTHSFWSVL
jgi:cell wall-associated NlpC family hydrolase